MHKDARVRFVVSIDATKTKMEAVETLRARTD